MIERIKKKLAERQNQNVEKEIEKDLLSYYKRKKTTRGFCQKYWLEKQERHISYLLRNMNRQLNIAKAMEEEKRIKKTTEILNNYKKEILGNINYIKGYR